MDHMHSHDINNEKTVTLQLRDVYCVGCADAVLGALRSNPHLTSAHIDWPNNVVHVSYHAGMLDVSEIERLIETTGCKCEPDVAGTARHEHEGQTGGEHLAHGVDVQPITMSTKHDRMQYEMLSTGAYKHHAPGHTAPQHSSGGAHEGEHRSHAHTQASPIVDGAAAHEKAGGTHSTPAAQPAHTHDQTDHLAHVGHEVQAGHIGMDHDMSDMSSPGMAAAMERDMRNKFFIALLLTIPTVLYSPLGRSLLGVSMPTFGLDPNWIMLVLTTPIVFYAGWIFIGGAYHSLRRGMLNMSVLIATGVLAAYLFSVLITFIGGESFFEAAAML